MIRMMVVDDDQYFRYAISTLLDWSIYGVEIVAEAVHGKQALQMLESKPIDLIMTDIRMPLMNGIELIREVKRLYPHIAVVALSAYDEFEFVREALKCGAYDYVLKYNLNEADMLKVLREAKERIQHSDEADGQELLHQSSLGRDVQMAVQYIEDHYNEHITLSDIATHVNLSANYLCNLFKAETGCQIVKYINQLRIEKAKRLLSETSMKAYEVAYHVGFESHTYFSTLFRKATGMTVHEFRRG